MNTENRKAQFRAYYYRNQARIQEESRLRQARKRAGKQETPDEAEARRTYNRAKYAERYGPAAAQQRAERMAAELSENVDLWKQGIFRNIVVALLADQWQKTYAYRQQWKRQHYVPHPRQRKPSVVTEPKVKPPPQTREEKLTYKRDYEKRKLVEAKDDTEKLAEIRKRRRDGNRRWLDKMKLEDPDKYSAYVKRQSAAELDRCRTNPQRKMARILRTKVYSAIRSQPGAKKAVSTFELIGCSIGELRKHLEGQFEAGMTWSNIGKGTDKWSIDHIRPCASFNLLDESQQTQAFHYTNLRPMWFVDNCSKNSNHEGRRWLHSDHTDPACQTARTGDSAVT